MEKLLVQGCRMRLRSAGSLEEDQDDEGRDYSNGQVDVEAPALRHFIRKCASDQWPNSCCNTVARSNDLGEHCWFFGDAENPMMVYEPELMPAAPTPAKARPTMRAALLGATAQIRNPSSKMKMAMR